MPAPRKSDRAKQASKSKRAACPICRKPVAVSEKCFPFCSERCRVIDLGRWLGGEYHIEVSADETDRDLPPAALPDHPFEPEDMP